MPSAVTAIPLDAIELDWTTYPQEGLNEASWLPDEDGE